ncbi:hypothetical protein [Luteitalea sp.]|uniref:hypothetical protein n=1 Tax=Luteitalea sp. TaxID=2004800 RepID=UPI0025B7D272|nr:hypothetical protein [Luteitalea sp.]
MAAGDRRHLALPCQRADGRLEVVVRQYATDGQQVTARFVGGVLVDYTIAGAR